MSSGSNVPGGDRASGASRDPSPIAGRSALGKYEVLRELGAGGMGTVYLAIDSNLRRTVALKVLHKERASNDTLVRRFESEAHAAAQLKHENIVTVYDAGQIDGHLFIALEFVDGTDIHELVAKRGAIPLKRSVEFIKQVVRALDHLHKRGIVHRDIKPSNLLLTKEGVVKLTDLGLARAVDESLESNITREGTTVGTVDYMAPEQARNSQAADIRSDIYSLGCTWYQMLTGEPPFPEGSVTNKLYSHISKPRPDPRSFNHTVPDEIVAVMHKMMARKVDDRYQTPIELLNDLDNLGSGYKKLDEILQGDADDNSPSPPSFANATPAHGSPLPLPPRQAARETDSGSRRTESERSVPEQRMPARQLPAADRRAPPPPRQTPARQIPTPDRPMPPSTRQTPPPERQMPAPERTMTGERQSIRGEPLPSKVGATNRRTSTRRGGVVSDEPVGTPRDPNRPLADLGSLSAPDWQPLAVKIGIGLAAIAALGLVIWFTQPYWRTDKSPTTTATRNPFDPSPPDPAGQAAVDDEATKKGDKSATSVKVADGEKQKSRETTKPLKPVVLAEAKKPTSNAKSARAMSIPAGPVERDEFPTWIEDLWDPHGAVASKGPPLRVIKVGRAGKDPGQTSSLSEALARLPADGGVIELRGPGPFLLPSQRIDKRRHVIFTSVAGRNGQPVETPERNRPANGSGPSALADPRPVIVIVPPTASPRAGGAKAASGLFASETSLTFYGVNLVAFADEFRGENPLRLVEVHSGDLTVQNCSLTLVGTRVAPTTAFTVSSAAADRPPRLLLDRMVVRGSELAAIQADLQSVDFLAINSLFVTGHAPILTLTTDTPSPGSAPVLGEGSFARILRFFSCTACSDESTVVLRANSDSADGPPPTRFHVLNSLFGVATQPQSPMIALTNWPALSTSADRAVRFKNLSWTSQAFVARGWQDNLVASAAGARLPVRDAQDWGQFWGDKRSSIDYQSTPFPTIGDLSAAMPAQFKSENLLVHDAAGDTSARGCDTGLLAVCSVDLIRRADAYSRRPTVASESPDEATTKGSVRDIDLDNPGIPAKGDLSKTINETDWPSGTRFLVHGVKKKLCGPINVVNRSLSIEFDKGLVLGFDDRKIEGAGDRNAFITVTGGSIEIVNATLRIESSTRGSTRRLLDVRGGSFSIRDCTFAGPRREYPAYEELIRFSSSQNDSLAPSEGEAFSGTVQNSFLSSPKNLFHGDLSARNLIFENSLLVAGNRIFDLRLPSGSNPSTLDLRACTLSAGGEYFHFSTNSADGASNRSRVFVENSLFAPPVRPSDGAAPHALLIGSVSSEFFHDRVDWWEYGSAYSDLIQLPSSATKSDATAEPLENWRQIAGPAHIVRSISGTGAVLLPSDVSTIKEVEAANFRLKPEAQAATWSDIGKAVGAELSVQPIRPVKRAAAPKPVAPKKQVPKNTGGGGI